MLEGYVYEPDWPLECRLVAVSFDPDKRFALSSILEWEVETVRAFDHRQFSCVPRDILRDPAMQRQFVRLLSEHINDAITTTTNNTGATD
jgi:hypothetical protein